MYNLAADIPAEIIPGLYLGSIHSLNMIEALGITHVLSVVNLPVPITAKVLQHKQIPVLDDESENILRHFPDCCAFISTALGSGGRVLVHCQAGVSRSATVVLAYLMQLRAASVDDMLPVVQGKRSVDPNDGFLLQLDAWERTGYQYEENNPVCAQTLRFLKVSSSYYTGSVDPSSFAAPQEGGGASQEAAYRCRKCRTLVATARHCLPLPASTAAHGGAAVFAGKRHKQAQNGAEVDGDHDPHSLFVEPLRWMDGIMGEVSGKLYCPKCQGRLGSFNWYGSQSSTGRWVAPAFQLHLSRLDEEKPQPELLAAIRCVAMCSVTYG